jgi:NDP-sugar pyrophosphorylase family protein
MSERRLAVLLAGGKGARLRPYTAVFPKPLVPVGDLPIIEILVRQLFAAGFTDFLISVGHLAALLQAYFSDHPLLAKGARIAFIHEKAPLGTAGPLRLIPELPDNFLVLNGDILTNLDFRALFEAHCASGALLTVATKARAVQIELGVIEREDRRIVGYREKPTLNYEISMGAYAYSRRAVAMIPADRRFDFPELVLLGVRAGAHVAAYPVDADWLDIGNPDDYALAQERMAIEPERYVPALPTQT